MSKRETPSGIHEEKKKRRSEMSKADFTGFSGVKVKNKTNDKSFTCYRRRRRLDRPSCCRSQNREWARGFLRK